MGEKTAISSDAYARWRESELGARTDALEKEAVFALTGSLKGLRVLDVGCGDGAYSIHAARLSAKVTGLDISRAMLDTARRRAYAAGESVEWCEGRAEALPFPAASFDVVIAVTLLCWVPDAAAAVREMARVVCPGGIVVIGELGRCSLWAFARRIRGWFGNKLWRKVHFWTPGELRRLVESNGLKFGALRGAVYYPPSRIVSKWLAPRDGSLSKITSIGAAFLCMRAAKPSSSAATSAVLSETIPPEHMYDGCKLHRAESSPYNLVPKWAGLIGIKSHAGASPRRGRSDKMKIEALSCSGGPKVLS